MCADPSSCFAVKYADDTCLVGLISNNDVSVYRDNVNNCVKWCNDNYLTLNAAKCKEIIFDFRKKRSNQVLNIMNVDVDVVSEYKYMYLGVYIDDKLNCNTGKVSAKCNQCLYFLRRMKSFNVHVHRYILYGLFNLFYISVV